MLWPTHHPLNTYGCHLQKRVRTRLIIILTREIILFCPNSSQIECLHRTLALNTCKLCLCFSTWRNSSNIGRNVWGCKKTVFLVPRLYPDAEIRECSLHGSLELVFPESSLFSPEFVNASQTAAIHQERIASAATCTETNEASGGECLKGVSPKFSRNFPEDAENAGDSQPAGMPSNTRPLGAAKLPSTDTLMLARPALLMSMANPMTCPFFHSEPNSWPSPG